MICECSACFQTLLVLKLYSEEELRLLQKYKTERSST